MPINEITPVHLQKYLNELVEHGYGYSTIKKQLSIVTAPLKQAAALHLIPADPCVGIKMPLREHVKKASRAVDAYSPEEQKALCKVLETYKRKGYKSFSSTRAILYLRNQWFSFPSHPNITNLLYYSII